MTNTTEEAEQLLYLKGRKRLHDPTEELISSKPLLLKISKDQNKKVGRGFMLALCHDNILAIWAIAGGIFLIILLLALCHENILAIWAIA